MLPTTSLLLAGVREVLSRAGYLSVAQLPPELSNAGGGVFEDATCVVGVRAYETWASLAAEWAAAQGALVELMSERIGRVEAKAWDGYLVLLTPASPDPGTVETIRYNTTRLRKLVGTGDDIRESSDLTRLLAPLLPLDLRDASMEEETSLDALPRLLESKGIIPSVTRHLIKGFLSTAPLMEHLHKHRAIDAVTKD
jgi:hypothetical protein